MKDKSRVFVTQIPKKRDPETRSFVDAFNIHPATEWGDITTMFPFDAVFYASKDLIDEVYRYLKEYSYSRGDCLLPLGDVSIISACAAVLAKNGPFSILKWDRNIQRYSKMNFLV